VSSPAHVRAAKTSASHKTLVFGPQPESDPPSAPGAERGAAQLTAGRLLDAIEDPAERKRTRDELVALAYQRGSAVNTPSLLEIDEVIDPLTTRATLKTALLAGARPSKDGWVNSRRRVGIDTW
jgi:hypothetical protein